MNHKKKTDDERSGMIIGGIITLGVGVLFLLYNLDVIPGMDYMWPIIPIIVGISLIIGAFFKSKKSEENKSDDTP